MDITVFYLSKLMVDVYLEELEMTTRHLIFILTNLKVGFLLSFIFYLFFHFLVMSLRIRLLKGMSLIHPIP